MEKAAFSQRDSEHGEGPFRVLWSRILVNTGVRREGWKLEDEACIVISCLPMAGRRPDLGRRLARMVAARAAEPCAVARPRLPRAVFDLEAVIVEEEFSCCDVDWPPQARVEELPMRICPGVVYMSTHGHRSDPS